MGLQAYVPASTAIQNGTWYHLAAVYEPSERMTIYVNGIREGTTTSSVPASLAKTPAPVMIGVDFDPTVTSRFFNGTIDEVKIYNRSLTAAEINSSYLAGIGQHYELSAAGIYQYNVTYQESQNYTAYNVSKILSVTRGNAN